jgi:DNA topoisomerase-1
MACTGYPDFSPRATEGDLENLQKEIAKRKERAQKEIEKRLEKIRTRYPGYSVRRDDDGGYTVYPMDHETPRRLILDLKALDKAIAERRQTDQTQVDARLQKIVARFPQIREFYDLELKNEAAGPAFSWQRKPFFCTYTRELTVDLPDLDKHDLSEQGEEEYCENCGRPMVLKKGRFGTFYACSGYPDCKTTKQIGGTQKKPDQPIDEICPTCGSGMVLKTGRFGEFTACSNYPSCKYVKQKTIGVNCPECSEGEVVERRSRKGKTFYGCNRYPDCKFVAWGKPVPEKCPECGNSYMIEKWLKAGPVWQCPNDDCKHKQPAPQPVAV